MSNGLKLVNVLVINSMFLGFGPVFLVIVISIVIEKILIQQTELSNSQKGIS